ncbi:MAG: ATP-binding cassette domain-containing protein [Methylacidiphilales bacterium]|nr:ATP-binding cassette domain-containing protein [Candidatus Methylacidiphilales bacterium]
MSEAPSNKHKSPYAVEARGVTQSFDGKRKVLSNVSFKVKHGEILIIMGGSGCGKSTLLKVLIGLLKPTEGEVFIDGTEITKLNDRELSSVRKRFGMLFQYSALFNSLTLGENVALPILESSDVSPSIAELMARLKLEMVGMNGFEHLKPAEISGGMKKRVGMARGLALDPDLLFCDEPTSGLDPVTTATIDKLTLDLTRMLGISAVVVTHDMTSAFRIGTQMIYLSDGKVLVSGTPEEVKQNPNPNLQQFINGHADGPIPFKLSKDDWLNSLKKQT